MALLKFTKSGIFCPQADIYVDPWRKVKKALITHGHSDHARRGHNYYLCTPLTKPILEHRLGKINCDVLRFGESISINGVHISFHPAGHILGSAQIRLEYKGEIWVVSGDYKVGNDGLTDPFEPVKCHHFITESTFGLPIYKWKNNKKVFNEINTWWSANRRKGLISVLQAYSLGKAQHLLQNLDQSIGQVYTNKSIEDINQIFRNKGVDLPGSTELSPIHGFEDLKGNLVISSSIAPITSLVGSKDLYSLGAASGWMMLRKMRKNRSVDKGFILSDHADWDGLLEAIKATEAENIYVTHGYTRMLTQYLKESGWNARIVETNFEGESIADIPTR